MALGRGAKVLIAAGCLGAALGLAVRSLAYFPLRIASNSMAPVVIAGDWIVVSARRPSARSRIERGDIVLFRYGSERAIKRVIAIAGDEVEILPDGVSVNGAPVAAAAFSTGAAQFAGVGDVLHVPDRHYYLLGDNINSSVDSRTFGALPESEIIGVVSLVINLP